MVLLLKFRDKWVQDAKCLSDLFGVHYRDNEFQSRITDEIKSKDGKGLLLILEGYDEAPDSVSLQTSQSVFLDLFNGKQLPNATVVITTRPSASSELRRMCRGDKSRRIEVLGFGNKEINEYINSSFSHHKELQSDFKQYLDLYPHIHSMMYVPLNSAIVTRVYQESKLTSSIVPKTMTQLYSSLIRTLLLRYLKEQPEHVIVKVNNFTDFPMSTYVQFLKLCEIAYSGIMKAQTKLIFSDLPSDFNTLGLMQSCPELYIDSGESFSHNFLHLTIQEFLAAYHISLFDEDKLEKEIKKLIEKPVVMKFLAALCQSKALFWKVIPKLLPASESPDGLSLSIFHLLFEAQDLSSYDTILGCSELYFQTQSSMKPFDCYVLGSCIASSASTCTWEIDFSKCDEIDYKMFVKGLIARTSIVKQTIILKHITDDCLCSFSSAMESALTLDYLKIISIIKGNTIPGLVTYLEPHVSNQVGLHSHVSLEDLSTEFHVNDLGDQMGFHPSDSEPHVIDFGGQIGLQQHLNPDQKDAAHWVTMIPINCSLTYLDITFGRIGTNDLAKALETNSTVKCLKLNHDTIENEGVVCFAKVLETNSTLKHLDLSNSNSTLPNEGAFLLAKALETNSTLKHLNLSNNAIQSEGAKYLAKALEINSTLKHMDLNNNKIQNKGAICLAKALEMNSALTLDYLDLSYNEIQNEGVACLSKALETNSTLKYLGVRSVSIDDSVCPPIDSMLRCNRSLETLDLSDNTDLTELGVSVLTISLSLGLNTTLKKLHLSPKYDHFSSTKVKCF